MNYTDLRAWANGPTVTVTCPVIRMVVYRLLSTVIISKYVPFIDNYNHLK